MRFGWKSVSGLLPISLVVLVFFYLPLANTFLSSLKDLDGTFIGFDRYTGLLAEEGFLDAVGFTLYIAVLSTVLSVVLAVIMALALRDTFVGRRLALFLNQMNISMPHMIVATMMIYLLGQKGFASAVLMNAGMIDSWNEFPLLVEFSSPYGVIISYTLKFAPFVCMSVLAVLQSMSRDYEDQSYSLGVGRMRTFAHVTLPAIWPAILSTSIMSFMYAFGSYEVPAILLHREVASTYVYNRYFDFYNPTGTLEGYAGSIIITAIVLMLSSILLYISAKRSDVFE